MKKMYPLLSVALSAILTACNPIEETGSPGFLTPGLVGATPPAGTPQLPGEYDLGTLPSALTVQWPRPPQIAREVNVRTLAELTAAVSVSGSRIRIENSIPNNISVSTSDLEIITSPGVSLGVWTVSRSVRRLRFFGGTYRGITLMPPKQWDPVEVTDPAWFIEDVMFDGLTVNAPAGSIGFAIRGNRVAILNSRVTAGTYSVWVGDHAPAQASDLIIANNRFTSSGAEATLRVHDTNKVVVVDNILTNGTPDADSKHNLRFHGTIDMAYASRNTLIYSGFMGGISDSGDLDQIGHMWLVDNTFHTRRMSLMRSEPPYVTVAEFRDNTIYSDLHSCFLCIPLPSGWINANNAISPYQPASL